VIVKSTATFFTVILLLTLKGGGGTPDLSFELIQIKSTDSSKKQPVKRIVCVAVESISFMKILNIPLVGSLKQLFNGVDYIWVDDNAGIGLTRQEVSCIDAMLKFC
jgi:hypothetical protein